MEATKLGFTTTTDGPFDGVLEKTKAALKEEGFGVLTEIDIRATLKEKLDADFRKYVILGACNPPLAHEALSHNLDIGLLLPCNVTIYESDAGEVVVSAVDPRTLLSLAGSEQGLQPIAQMASEKLQRALKNL